MGDAVRDWSVRLNRFAFVNRVVKRKRTPGAKAPRVLRNKKTKPKGLVYLEAERLVFRLWLSVLDDDSRK
jgi:hypothetical protein